MKILVLSDSHGDVDSMVEVVTKERPDAIFHLGDLIGDAQELHNEFPNIIKPEDFLKIPGLKLEYEGYLRDYKV